MAPSAMDHPETSTSGWVDCDALRTDFTLAMSAMYKTEVPLYGNLIRIVADVNKSALSAGRKTLDPKVMEMRYGGAERQSPIDIERHGAIRLGTSQELQTMRRVFAVIGLSPVGYYDLSEAGLPMHATCFRPLTQQSLAKNPFRVFTSVLRPELIKNDETRKLALDLLSKRNIFSDALMQLLDLADGQGGRLTMEQGSRFVVEAMKTFGWHGTAAATSDQYQCLKAEHPILADVACFSSSHINHLTPRTLDINLAQDQMIAQGLMVKDRIEGPPSRSCPILLRQTSFLAIEEPIKFRGAGEDGGEASSVEGSHRARFGEIEERGAAVTPAGRALYDQLLGEAMGAAQAKADVTAEVMDELVAQAFEKYPDDWTVLRKQGLVYFSYQCGNNQANTKLGQDEYQLEDLVEMGVLDATPITYEDFLPLSAAGIFQSNLGSQSSKVPNSADPHPKCMEESLGAAISDYDELYRKMQSDSIVACSSKLGVRIMS